MYPLGKLSYLCHICSIPTKLAVVTLCVWAHTHSRDGSDHYRISQGDGRPLLKLPRRPSLNPEAVSEACAVTATEALCDSSVCLATVGFCSVVEVSNSTWSRVVVSCLVCSILGVSNADLVVSVLVSSPTLTAWSVGSALVFSCALTAWFFSSSLISNSASFSLVTYSTASRPSSTPWVWTIIPMPVLPLLHHDPGVFVVCFLFC